VKTSPQTIDVQGVDEDLRGVWTRGETPKELVLSDGSTLRLEPGEDGRVEWRRDGSGDSPEHLSTDEARELAGRGFAGYVGVRTRSEAEWLRAVADWCNGEAGRLEQELAGRPT
jgi:hypothetical protein